MTLLCAFRRLKDYINSAQHVEYLRLKMSDKFQATLLMKIMAKSVPLDPKIKAIKKHCVY